MIDAEFRRRLKESEYGIGRLRAPAALVDAAGGSLPVDAGRFTESTALDYSELD